VRLSPHQWLTRRVYGCEKGRSEPRIGYRLLDVATDLQIGRATMRQLWVAAGASTDAVDIVLAKVPLGARLSFEVLPPEQVATLHLRQGEARELAF
jgi:hypothetical protein